MLKVFLISGPAGVGKSTISRKLAEQLGQSAYIEGDTINHLVIGGYLPPWENEELLTLTWKNIADLTVNFLEENMHVIIDYVIFPEEAAWLAKAASAEMAGVEVIYTILWAEADELLRRDAERKEEHRMGKRCLELMDEFTEKEISSRFFYDTTKLTVDDAEKITLRIKTDSRFVF